MYVYVYFNGIMAVPGLNYWSQYSDEDRQGMRLKTHQNCPFGEGVNDTNDHSANLHLSKFFPVIPGTLCDVSLFPNFHLGLIHKNLSNQSCSQEFWFWGLSPKHISPLALDPFSLLFSSPCPFPRGPVQ